MRLRQSDTRSGTGARHSPTPIITTAIYRHGQDVGYCITRDKDPATTGMIRWAEGPDRWAPILDALDRRLPARRGGKVPVVRVLLGGLGVPAATVRAELVWAHAGRCRFEFEPVPEWEVLSALGYPSRQGGPRPRASRFIARVAGAGSIASSSLTLLSAWAAGMIVPLTPVKPPRIDPQEGARGEAPAQSLPARSPHLPDQLVPRSLLRDFVPVSDMTLWRWIQSGSFPPPLQVRSRNYWRLSELMEWLDSKARGPRSG